MTKKCKIAVCVILVVLVCLCPTRQNIKGSTRRIGIGNKMPEFSASDTSGKVFDYKHGVGKVLMVVFLSANQKNSAQAAADIKGIVTKLASQAERLKVVVAIDDPNSQTFFRSNPNEPVVGIHVVADTEYKLWGKFGIIATPTVIISDTNDTVLWVEAGHSYDFAPVIRARLNQALGIAQEIDPNDASRVKTVTNATVAARIQRHLQMAKILQAKGRIESAINEVRKAEELDPNSVEAALELGELFCRAGKNEAALKIVERMKATKRLDKARLLLISGWAKRQMGNLETAEKNLLEATKLNPKSCRGFFELGQVYQAKGDKDKAIAAYYRALTLVFGGR
ncbi:MAG: tetratricopeptide repeat protein [Phycisphaerae bacterium]